MIFKSLQRGFLKRQVLTGFIIGGYSLNSIRYDNDTLLTADTKTAEIFNQVKLE